MKILVILTNLFDCIYHWIDSCINDIGDKIIEIIGGCFRETGWEEECLDEYDILQDDWVLYDEQHFEDIVQDEPQS